MEQSASSAPRVLEDVCPKVRAVVCGCDAACWDDEVAPEDLVVDISVCEDVDEGFVVGRVEDCGGGVGASEEGFGGVDGAPVVEGDGPVLVLLEAVVSIGTIVNINRRLEYLQQLCW